jgi:protoheme IX farnesyltransferase
MQNTLEPSLRLHASFAEVVRSYWQLTKPRIIILLLITTAAGMLLAGRGQVEPGLFLATLVGGWLAASAANTINCLYDRDIDFVMERTRWRPLPSGRIQPRDAWIFALILAGLSFVLLTLVANVLAALLAMSGIVFYVLVYTHWLKRHTTQNIVIGGAAGAIPPLVGWAAVTGDLSWSAWILFGIVFFWTPPHFWALALMIRDDYAAVRVPMLPVVVGDSATARQIAAYSLGLLPFSLLLIWPPDGCGVVYASITTLLGLELIRRSGWLLQQPGDRPLAKSLFKFSILYLMMLCAAVALDSLPPVQAVDQALLEQFKLWWSLRPWA